MRNDKDRTSQLDRRGFLKGAGVAIGSVGAAAALADGEVKAATDQDEAQSSGYRETAHVRRYYELARF